MILEGCKIETLFLFTCPVCIARQEKGVNRVARVARGTEERKEGEGQLHFELTEHSDSTLSHTRKGQTDTVTEEKCTSRRKNTIGDVQDDIAA